LVFSDVTQVPCWKRALSYYSFMVATMLWWLLGDESIAQSHRQMRSSVGFSAIELQQWHVTANPSLSCWVLGLAVWHPGGPAVSSALAPIPRPVAHSARFWAPALACSPFSWALADRRPDPMPPCSRTPPRTAQLTLQRRVEVRGSLEAWSQEWRLTMPTILAVGCHALAPHPGPCIAHEGMGGLLAPP
jgi:hypothetical protein